MCPRSQPRCPRSQPRLYFIPQSKVENAQVSKNPYLRKLLTNWSCPGTTYPLHSLDDYSGNGKLQQ